MLSRGFIFSLDTLLAAYLVIISVVVVLGSLEVLSQINFDFQTLQAYGEDISHFEYYYLGLSAKCGLQKIYSLSTNCLGARVTYVPHLYRYPDLYKGSPNYWSQALTESVGGKSIVEYSLDQICFGDY